MSKKHYIQFVELLKKHKTSNKFKNDFINILKNDNLKFDEKIFLTKLRS